MAVSLFIMHFPRPSVSDDIIPAIFDLNDKGCGQTMTDLVAELLGRFLRIPIPVAGTVQIAL